MSVPPEVLDELYGLAPQEFTAARDARAKELRAAGDREGAAAVKKLPRPSAAAWAVNRLVRRDPVRVYEVLELGEDLRRAQAELDGSRLRVLSRKRHTAVSSAVRAAEDLAREAGHPLSGAVSRQVEATLHAAMVDPHAAARVRDGRLAESLQPAGFGLGAALGDSPPDKPATMPAIAAPTPSDGDVTEEGVETKPTEATEETKDTGTEAVRAVVESARRRAHEAEDAAARADEALAAAEKRLDVALDARRRAAERVRRLRRELRGAEHDESAAGRAAESADGERDEAARVAQRAGRALDAARRRLQALGLPEDPELDGYDGRDRQRRADPDQQR